MLKPPLDNPLQLNLRINDGMRQHPSPTPLRVLVFSIEKNNIHLVGEKNDTWAAESSDLNLPIRIWNSTLKVPPTECIILYKEETGTYMEFFFEEAETMHKNSDEIGVWKYINRKGDMHFSLFND